MLKFIVPPIVGAIIGFITNALAIKMLFHPRKPLYIGKFRVPLTPGLIPKEKNRIAKSIGNAVSTQLLSSDMITQALLSDEMINKIQKNTEDFFEKNKNNEKTIEEVINDAHSGNEGNNSGKLKEDFINIICNRIIDMQLGNNFSSSILEKLRNGLNLIGGGLFTQHMINDEFLDSLSKSIGEHIDKIIALNSKDIVQGIVDKEAEKIAKIKICDVIEKYSDKLPEITDSIVGLYRRAVEISVEKIFASIDTAKIIENRICELNVVELESLIFSVMNKELKAIVYLGALLGFLMGFINILLQF